MKNIRVVFSFYDPQGIVDDYVLSFLSALAEHANDFIIIVNGKLSQDGRSKLDCYGEVIVRSNTGFDAAGYQLGLQQQGNFDEVILCNDTCFGPLYPFSEMFDSMSSRNIDFWGITRHNAVEHIPAHIQSYFIVIRRNMLESVEFKKYWNDLPVFSSYDDIVNKHEMKFTKHFEELGFSWDTYINADELYDRSPAVMYDLPFEAVKIYRCPLIKRRLFFNEYDRIFNYTCGQESVRLINYIKENMEYDLDMVYQNLLRIYHLCDLKTNFHWNFILPSSGSSKNSASNSRVALFMFIYNLGQIKDYLLYANSMPKNSDCYIYVKTSCQKEEVLQFSAESNIGLIDVRVLDDKNIYSIFIDFLKLLNKYDLACVSKVHNNNQDVQKSIEAGFNYRCFENILRSPAYVEAIINQFISDQNLGILTPPPPNHGNYFDSYISKWGSYYKETCDILDLLCLHVPMSENKEPIFPFGSCFWARTSALKPLFEYHWTEDQMTAISDKLNGDPWRAFERTYGFIAQSQGFFTAFVLSDSFAPIEFTNIEYMLTSLSKSAFDTTPHTNFHSNKMILRICMRLFSPVLALYRKMRNKIKPKYMRKLRLMLKGIFKII